MKLYKGPRAIIGFREHMFCARVNRKILLVDHIFLAWLTGYTHSDAI